jgi:prophage antirepressor-like protein
MNGDVTPFLFEGENLVRVVMRDGNPWFVAADVCKVLGIKNSRDALEKLDDDEKGVALTDTLRGPQEVSIVSEGGLYTLVLRSRDATKQGTVPHRFRRWITGEVIPQIRQTGGYTPKATIEPPPHPEHREFPEWPLEEMRTKGQMVTLYRLTYGPPSGQWIMPILGFPQPPKHLITEGRQMDLFTETITITRGPRQEDE